MGSDATKWMPGATLAGILLFTLAALVLVPLLGLTTGLDGREGTLVVAMLLVVGVVQLAVVRLLVLPGAISNPDATEEQTTILAYSFPQSAAIYGLVASITTGQGFVALPLGAIALLSWLVVRAYLRGSYGEDRGSRMREHQR